MMWRPDQSILNRNSADPDEMAHMSHFIRIYTVSKIFEFDCRGKILTTENVLGRVGKCI